MKAIIQSISSSPRGVYDFFPQEFYTIRGWTTGPEDRKVDLTISGNVIDKPLFDLDQADWEYELEISIKGKPRSLESILLLK